MASSERVFLDSASFGDEEENSEDLSHARHAREQALPNYHEDSGEYVAETNDIPVSAKPLLQRPKGRSRLSVIHAEDDPHSTEPIPRIQAAREAQLGVASERAGREQVAIEDANKKDIKTYLAANTFKCASARDPEALSEFAYAPTDKGIILSVEKPLSNTNFKRMKALLRRRVKPSRFVHSVMVAETAEKMALAYDVDPRIARIAGLLHDWDKALSPKRLRDRIAHYQLDIDGPMQINMPQLLHGPTAAAVLADEFPEFGEEVFQAIERHTVGGLGMTPLDMIVFCADKLEPGNDVQVYRDLYNQIGKIDLVDLFLAVQREGLVYLLRSNRPLNVDAVEVWNFYCAERQRDSE
jgi:predicted HD superfamily hydrolase involved in NAD metabolism